MTKTWEFFPININKDEVENFHTTIFQDNMFRNYRFMVFDFTEDINIFGILRKY